MHPSTNLRMIVSLKWTVVIPKSNLIEFFSHIGNIISIDICKQFYL